MICELEKEAAELYNKAKGTNNEIDWLKIGAEFQENLEQGKRRELGVHYTSEENILKLIKPLFLDDLKAEFELAKSDKQKILVFLDKLAKLKFLDPACGCGNFLIIAFRELKLLEFEALTALSEYLEINNTYFRVNPDQFYGIEIEEEPCRVAELCLYSVGLQMYHEGIKRFNLNHSKMYFEPPKTIIHANALRIDWNDVIPKEQLNYIMGNPPFVGFHLRNHEQQNDMDLVFGKNFKKYGDYVTAWFKKASDYMLNTKIETAFVSTDSISQGIQPAILWEPLMKENNTEINFAYRTFKWGNESTEKKAQVHCVIIGFSNYKNNKEKKIYSLNESKKVEHINPYLVDAQDVMASARNHPICNIPDMIIGNRAYDGGNLKLNEEEKELIIEENKMAEKWIKPFIDAKEFLNGGNRWCLWLTDATPSELKKCNLIMKKIKKCQKHRLNSKSPAIQKFASTPALFAETRQPSSHYLVVPEISSGNRKYIPMGFVGKNIISSNRLRLIPNATLYHFGILTSSVHMAWVKAVCGRLGGGCVYSIFIVYNNFIWPNPTAKQKEEIEKLAQGVLDARKLYSESTLAYLYDPNTMPPELLEAHNKLDNAVKEAYGTKGFETEEEIVASLMELYKKAIDERELNL